MSGMTNFAVYTSSPTFFIQIATLRSFSKAPNLPAAAVPSGQVTHSSGYQGLCPVQRGFIAMSGPSDTAAAGLR
jgi:hypothetical protein